MEDRRTLIGDSAIEVIARDGVRALTHRSVDAEANLASGSTSYYCRTRAQLLALTTDRLVALLRGYVEYSGVQQLESSDPSDLVDALTGMIEGLLADYRGELAARHALIVELTGTIDTTDLISSLLDPSDIAGALQSAGVKDVERHAQDLLTALEGILWERTLGRLADAEFDADRDGALLESALEGAGKGRRGILGLRR